MPTPNWSKYRPFPDPRKQGILRAPLGPGVYDLRRISTKERVLFGKGSNCAERMCSLFPQPIGAAGRNNAAKRNYVRRHIKDIEYRTISFTTKAQAVAFEKQHKAKHADEYKFPT
jgi:hypothetical protein